MRHTPARQFASQIVGGAGMAPLSHTYEMKKNGFEAAGVVSLWLGHVRVLTYHRYVIHYPHAASLPPPYNTVLE